MTVALLTDRIWATLTAAVKRRRVRPLVAVAYFGQGAAKLLPLRRGSRLVVDASENAVKAGQTCPAELKKLLSRGVRIYTRKNLHAKIFVIGRKAFIGSANVSHNSANNLHEAMVVTTDSETLAAARTFVRKSCLQELGPESLSRLAKIYRPPKLVGGLNRRKRRSSTNSPDDLPRMQLVQLEIEAPPKESKDAEAAGRKLATRRMKNPRRHELDEYWVSGVCSVVPGDIVMQVVKEANSRYMVDPPGTIVHTKKWRKGARKLTFVFVELPTQRRMSLRRLAKCLGRGSKGRLLRNGRVGRQFASRLLQTWQN